MTSGKGGTGKTTSAAAISSCLAALGHRTLCVDCDIGLRNLDISLGMSDFTVTDISDVAEGRVSVREAAHEHPRLPNLFFLAAPVYRAPEDIDPEAMAGLIAAAREEYEYTILDAPAGIGAGFALATASADTAIIVATGDLSSVRDAGRTRETLWNMGISDVRLLINRVERRKWKRFHTSVDDIVDSTGARLIGVVRDDDSVPEAAAADSPLVLYVGRGAAMDFLDVARRIQGEEIPI
jgi:septum site-determining protein MinD